MALLYNSHLVSWKSKLWILPKLIGEPQNSLRNFNNKKTARYSLVLRENVSLFPHITLIGPNLLTIKGAKTLFYGLGHGFFRVKQKSRNDILPQFLESYCRSEQIFARGNYHLLNLLTRITQKTQDVLSKSQLIALELQTIFFVQY